LQEAIQEQGQRGGRNRKPEYSLEDITFTEQEKHTMAKQALVTQTEDEMSIALTVQEVDAREAYNAAIYALQIAWHARREKAWRIYEDELADNDSDYRHAVTMAQRAYRDGTSDLNIA
jgi:hypothetical protein